MNPVPPGALASFTSTQPLVVEQYYYLAMGNRADNCDWILEATQDSAEPSPLSAGAPTLGADEFCVNHYQDL